MPLVSFPCHQEFVNSIVGDIEFSAITREEILTRLRDYLKIMRTVYSNPPGYSTTTELRGVQLTYTWIPHDADASWYVNRSHKVFYNTCEVLQTCNPKIFNDQFIRNIDLDFYKYWKQRK